MGLTILTLLGSNKENAYNILPLLYLTYSYAQIGLTSIFINFELPKLKIESKDKRIKYLSEIVAMVFLILSTSIGLVSPQVGFLLLGLGSYWAIDSLLIIIRRNKWYLYLALGITLFVFLLLFGLLYSKYPTPNDPLLISILLLALPLVSLFGEISEKFKRKNN